MQDAFSQELWALHRQLRGLAFSLTGNITDAEDLVAETFEKALRHRSSFHGGSLLAWTSRMLKNAHIDDRRSAWNRYRDRSPSVEEVEDIIGADSDAEQKLMLQQTLTILAGFGKYCHEVLVLSALGYKIREIAEWLDIPLGTVGNRMMECRQKFYDETGPMQEN
jgi:RNA polymerase sigma factor (sigma-70 family)